MAVDTRARPDQQPAPAPERVPAPQRVPAHPATGTWATALISTTDESTGTPLPVRRFTADEYYRMAEAGILRPDERVELLDGVVVVMNANGPPHASTSAAAADLLRDRLGRAVVVREQLPVRLDDSWELELDVAVVPAPHGGYRSSHPTANDVVLLLEVADSSAAVDRRVKLPRYAAAGIVETWLANLAFDCDIITGERLTERVLEVYRKPGPDGYTEVRVLRGGETITPEAFPDVVVPVAELLGETDDDQADGEADGADADPAEGAQR